MPAANMCSKYLHGPMAVGTLITICNAIHWLHPAQAKQLPGQGGPSMPISLTTSTTHPRSSSAQLTGIYPTMLNPQHTPAPLRPYITHTMSMCMRSSLDAGPAALRCKPALPYHYPQVNHPPSVSGCSHAYQVGGCNQIT